MSVVLCAATLVGCNPSDKFSFYGQRGYDVSLFGTPQGIVLLDVENRSGSKLKIMDIDVTVSDGRTEALTARLDSPVVLPRHTRDTLEVRMNLGVRHLLPALSLVKTLSRSPDKAYVSGQVTMSLYGIKVKKKFENKPVSEFLAIFGVRM